MIREQLAELAPTHREVRLVDDLETHVVEHGCDPFREGGEALGGSGQEVAGVTAVVLMVESAQFLGAGLC